MYINVIILCTDVLLYIEEVSHVHSSILFYCLQMCGRNVYTDISCLIVWYVICFLCTRVMIRNV